MDNKKIGLFIQKLRKEKKITQEEMGKKLGVSNKTISNWENGLSSPDISFLDDLSKLFDVSVLELLKGRKLDKDEYINNKDLVDSLTYTEKQSKRTFIKKINVASTVLGFLIMITVILFNLNNMFILSKKYYNSEKYVIDNSIYNNIQLILNNQGKYSNEDYAVIKEYVEEFKTEYDKVDLKKYANKDLVFEDAVNFVNEFRNFNVSMAKLSNVYEVLNKYGDVYKNARYNIMNNSWMADEYYKAMNEVYYNSYSYRTTYLEFNQNISTYIGLCLENEKLIFNDIIEVGDINEK